MLRLTADRDTAHRIDQKAEPAEARVWPAQVWSTANRGRVCKILSVAALILLSLLLLASPRLIQPSDLYHTSSMQPVFDLSSRLPGLMSHSPPSSSSPLSDSASASASSSSSNRPPLRVVTYGTHAGYKFCWLVISAAQERLPLVVLGYGVTHQRGHLGFKLTAALEYLQTLEDDELVMFVDAFDVVLTNNATQLLLAFHALNSSLVFSAEKGCWPYLDGRAHGDGLCLRYYPDKPVDTLYRFVNTGSWMGYVWAARRLLNDIVSFHLASHTHTAGDQQAGEGLAHVGSLNDQELITDYFVCDYLQSLYKHGGEQAVLDRVGGVFGDTSAAQAVARINACQLTGEERYNVSLDYYASMFQSLHNSEVDQTIHAEQRLDVHVDWDDKAGRWRNKAGYYPAIFHVNGGGKAHIDTVWQRAITGYRQLTDADYGMVQRYNATAAAYEHFPVQEECGKEEQELAQLKGWPQRVV